jgi:hypothetical protein
MFGDATRFKHFGGGRGPFGFPNVSGASNFSEAAGRGFAAGVADAAEERAAYQRLGVIG